MRFTQPRSVQAEQTMVSRVFARTITQITTLPLSLIPTGTTLKRFIIRQIPDVPGIYWAVETLTVKQA